MGADDVILQGLIDMVANSQIVRFLLGIGLLVLAARIMPMSSPAWPAPMRAYAVPALLLVCALAVLASLG